MKRFTNLLLAGALATSMFACGGGYDPENPLLGTWKLVKEEGKWASGLSEGTEYTFEGDSLMTYPFLIGDIENTWWTSGDTVFWYGKEIGEDFTMSFTYEILEEGKKMTMKNATADQTWHMERQ